MFHINRKRASIAAVAVAGLLALADAGGAAETALKERFDYLSQNGNSNCSAKFLDTIQTMPASDRLQGSCCSPMDFDRYAEQVEGLRKYSNIGEIPTDPNDIETGLARTLIAAKAIALSADEHVPTTTPWRNAEEGGPCCYRC